MHIEIKKTNKVITNKVITNMKKQIDILGYSLHLANDLSSGKPYYDVYYDWVWIGELHDMSFQSLDEDSDEYVIDEEKLLELIDGLK